jgi:hypothetical protein
MHFMCLAIRLLALVAIGLHLAAGWLGEEAAWSVWAYTVVPAPLGWLAAALAASLAFPPISAAVGRWWWRLQDLAARRFQVTPFAGTRRVWFAAVALGMALPFWALRLRHLRWGDAYFLVRALSYTGPDRPIWTIYNWQAPFTIFTHARLWLWLNPRPGISVENLYAVTSVLAGVGFVYVLFLLADSLGRDAAEKATFFGLVVTSGAMQLFFGYIENYTLISLGILISLYLGLRSLQRGASLAWPSLALAVTNAYHPSTLVLWPAMGYVAWRRASGAGARGKLREWGRLLGPPILVFVCLVGLMSAGGHGPAALLDNDRPGGADGIPFVPLFEVSNEWQHYTMFSGAHLLDWANEHFLISPVGLPLLLLGFIAYIARRKPAGADRDGQGIDRAESGQGETEVTRFLTAASLAYLVLTFVWNPDYGGRQDWDLFAPSAFVYTPLATYWLIRLFRASAVAGAGGCSLGQAARLLVAVSALHTLAWIYYNTLPWPAA